MGPSAKTPGMHMKPQLSGETLRQLFAMVDAVPRLDRSAREQISIEASRRLLSAVDELVRRARRDQSQIPRVHLLAALNRERDERLHCQLLRWLLDPLETHGYGAAFLEALL